MERIRILIYTDIAAISEDPQSSWALTDLKRFICHALKGIIELDVRVLNRHWDYENKKEVNGCNKLTKALLDPLHELWVLGARQINQPDANPPQLYNELIDEEIDLLRKWMVTGGVLITGDHSNPDPTLGKGSCKDDHKKFLGLGRALGLRIPRAGELRVWEGPPTACFDGDLETRDNYNTLEGADSCKLDNPGLKLQEDPAAQTIFPDPFCPPHELFQRFIKGSIETLPITKFPDHGHEGQVIVPKNLGGEWPAHSPFPKVIARSRDKRFQYERRLYPLMVAYDGDEVRRGRIVADASFHHYLNVNLRTIPDRDDIGLPKPGTDLDQIAQYYRNLVIYLAPREVRQKIQYDLLFRLSKHPDVLEVRANSAYVIGATARAVLERDLSPSNVKMLLPTSGEAGSQSFSDHLISYLFLARSGLTEAEIFGPEVILGEIMRNYHNGFAALGIGDPGLLDKNPMGSDVIIRAFLKAQNALNSGLSMSLTKNSEIELATTKENIMAFDCAGDWKSCIKRGGQCNEGEHEGVLTIAFINTAGLFTGSFTARGSFIPTEPIVGKCSDTSPHLTLVRVGRDANIHIYSGDWDGQDHVNGHHRVVQGLNLETVTTDDDWVGTHTT